MNYEIHGKHDGFHWIELDDNGNQVAESDEAWPTGDQVEVPKQKR